MRYLAMTGWCVRGKGERQTANPFSHGHCIYVGSICMPARNKSASFFLCICLSRASWLIRFYQDFSERVDLKYKLITAFLDFA